VCGHTSDTQRHAGARARVCSNGACSTHKTRLAFFHTHCRRLRCALCPVFSPLCAVPSGLWPASSALFLCCALCFLCGALCFLCGALCFLCCVSCFRCCAFGLSVLSALLVVQFAVCEVSSAFCVVPPVFCSVCACAILFGPLLLCFIAGDGDRGGGNDDQPRPGSKLLCVDGPAGQTGAGPPARAPLSPPSETLLRLHRVTGRPPAAAAPIHHRNPALTASTTPLMLPSALPCRSASRRRPTASAARSHSTRRPRWSGISAKSW
jgi:hypothetical protein